jgi:hypothetical protein
MNLKLQTHDISMLRQLVEQQLIFPEFKGPGLITIEDYMATYNDMDFKTVDNNELPFDEVMRNLSIYIDIAAHRHNAVIIGGKESLKQYYIKTHNPRKSTHTITFTDEEINHLVKSLICSDGVPVFINNSFTSDLFKKLTQ